MQNVYFGLNICNQLVHNPSDLFYCTGICTFNALPVADAKIRYIYRDIRLYIFLYVVVYNKFEKFNVSLVLSGR